MHPCPPPRRSLEPVLLLSAGYIPLGVVSWTKAVSLVWQDKADAIETQERSIRSPSITIPAPSVVRLRRMVRPRDATVKLSRKNLFFRDGYTCQYCARRLPPAKLNIDHVVPRNRGGKTLWTNVVTACIVDNIRKGGRTPDEAGMTLLKHPEAPDWSPAERILATVGQVPDRWRSYLGGAADVIRLAI